MGHLVFNPVLHLPVELRRRERDLGVPGAGLVQTPGPAVLPGSGGPDFCGIWIDVSGGGQVNSTGPNPWPRCPTLQWGP